MTWEDLKRRKLVQWAAAYLAGAWLVLDVTSLLGGHLGWPGWLHRVLIVLAAVGFPLALVVAWYHGEKGRQRVSGPELLMVAALVVVAVVAVRIVLPDPGDAPSAAAAEPPVVERSIAVLPLDDLSSAEEHAFFAEAMTEEITAALTQVPGLVVKSRNSAAQFAGSGQTVPAFARTIGVAHVLTGSVQRSEDRARITVQLIDARTDDHLWSQTYERDLTELFHVQAEVAEEVANRLAATFTTRARERIVAGATEDPVAYDLFLRSASSSGRPDEQMSLLRRAVERDPAFWPAWEKLGDLYLAGEQRGRGEWGDSARVAFDRALEAAGDPSATVRLEAYRALAFGGNEEEAIARLREAAEESPSDLALVESLAELLQVKGRLPEAARWRRRAALLDPLNPWQWIALWYPYYWVGMYQPGEDALFRASGLAPEGALPWRLLAYHWSLQGRVEDALAAADSSAVRGSGQGPRAMVLWMARDFEAARETFPADSTLPLPMLMWAIDTHLQVGDSATANRLLGRVRGALEGRVLEDYLPEARVYPRLQLAALEGDRDKAVERLRVYVERGGRDWEWIERSPLFDAVRDAPGFQRQMEELRDLVAAMRREMEGDLRSGRVE